MTYKGKSTDAERVDPQQSTAPSEAMLRAEIGFWRDLLESCDHSLPPDSIERMRQALALAEYRFLQSCRNSQAGRRPGDGPIMTSPAGEEFLH